LSIALGEVGVVKIHFTVKTDGSIGEVTVIQSSSHPRLDQAAVDGVMKWHFDQQKIDGITVEVSYETPITFSRNKKSDW
jgi:TonB family protein